ncbi:hypothetical protein D1872_157180 [compost metagenome]
MYYFITADEGECVKMDCSIDDVFLKRNINELYATIKMGVNFQIRLKGMSNVNSYRGEILLNAELNALKNSISINLLKLITDPINRPYDPGLFFSKQEIQPTPICLENVVLWEYPYDSLVHNPNWRSEFNEVFLQTAKSQITEQMRSFQFQDTKGGYHTLVEIVDQFEIVNWYIY